MHPFSVLTLGIFVAGYITARWDLVTRLYELAIFAWDHGVVTRTAKGFLLLSVFFFLLVIPINHLSQKEYLQVRVPISDTFDLRDSHESAAATNSPLNSIPVLYNSVSLLGNNCAAAARFSFLSGG
ncbi:hypothetical protein BJX63DRAFT_74219 [Aspergillus granulosus]|uniref:Uncharacterized protein n=1 Tax=Aspergillus granulosus TaxID=176169 RepID=A0ABR4GWC0_9EURO